MLQVYRAAEIYRAAEKVRGFAINSAGGVFVTCGHGMTNSRLDRRAELQKAMISAAK